MGDEIAAVKEASSDIRWRKAQRTASEIAEHLAGSVVDKESLERRLAEIVKENAMLKVRCSVATMELTKERQRLQGEIVDLKSQVAAAQKAPQTTAGGRLVAESAARERLLKDEFERIVQSLRVDLKMERQRTESQLKAMKDRLAGCICGEFRMSKSRAALPEHWSVRASK